MQCQVAVKSLRTIVIDFYDTILWTEGVSTETLPYILAIF